MWYTRDRFRVERATALAILCAVQQGISAASLPARDEEPDMTSFDLVSAAAVLAMVGGLAAVLWEVLTKDPRSLLEMMDDSRRSEEHTSELQSLMRISYAVFCLKKNTNKHKEA